MQLVIHTIIHVQNDALVKHSENGIPMIIIHGKLTPSLVRIFLVKSDTGKMNDQRLSFHEYVR